MKFNKLVGLLALGIALYLIWRIRFVVLLAFTAIALATGLNCVVRWFTRRGLRRSTAIVLTLIALGALIAILIALAVPPFIAQVSQWLDRAPAEINRISLWIETLDDQLPVELAEQLQRLDMLIQDIPRILQDIFSNFMLVFRGTLSILFNGLLVLVITVMLLANPKAYRQSFVLLFPQFYRDRINAILDDCEVSLVAWGVGIVFNMAVITTMSLVGLAIIDVPLPIANAFVAGILTFIPNVGPVLSVIPPAVLGLLDAPWKAAAVVVLYIAIQQVESNFLTPLVMKHQVSLLPALTLLSQLIMGVLFGFIGLFLALPIVVIAQVWLRELLVKDIMDVWHKT